MGVRAQRATPRICQLLSSEPLSGAHVCLAVCRQDGGQGLVGRAGLRLESQLFRSNSSTAKGCDTATRGRGAGTAAAAGPAAATIHRLPGAAPLLKSDTSASANCELAVARTARPQRPTDTRMRAAASFMPKQPSESSPWRGLPRLQHSADLPQLRFDRAATGVYSICSQHLLVVIWGRTSIAVAHFAAPSACPAVHAPSGTGPFISESKVWSLTCGRAVAGGPPLRRAAMNSGDSWRHLFEFAGSAFGGSSLDLPYKFCLVHLLFNQSGLAASGPWMTRCTTHILTKMLFARCVMRCTTRAWGGSEQVAAKRSGGLTILI